MNVSQEETMKNPKMLLALVLLLTPLWAAGLLIPQNGGSHIKIKDHKVDVVINNSFAQTTVKQTFINTGSADCEAVYSFPIPENASVASLSIWISGKEQIGEVVEKTKAKEIYNQQKTEGKKSALAEQNGHKTFRISVSNVPAGENTDVHLTYYQPLKIDQNIGRFVYPLTDGQTDDVESSFWESDDEVIGTFSFNCVLKSAFPIKEVRLPKHQQSANIQKKSDRFGDIYTVNVSTGEGARLNQDIVLYYRLDKSAPARVELIPFREPGSAKGHFMTVITPGADLKPIQNGTDWTFVLDVSGSMHGGKLKTLCEGVRKSIRRMSPEDRFRVITFSDNTRDLFNGFIAMNSQDVESALQTISNLRTEGGTNLYAGLHAGIENLESDRSNGVILVTDGEANRGLIEHKDFLGLIKTVDVRIFTFVISNSANRPLLKRIANESGGFAMTISESDDIGGRIMQAKNRIALQNIRDLRLSFSGNKVSHITPKQLPSLYAGEQLVLFGTYNKPGVVRLELTGVIEGVQKQWSCMVALPDIAEDNPEIERLWALSEIEDRMVQIRESGESETLVNEIKKLGTGYSLVTEYTSMIVVDQEEKERYGLDNANRDRVQKEREAQLKRAAKPVQNNRVDTEQKAFNGKSHDFGSGPVGFLFLFFASIMRFFKSHIRKDDE